MLLPTYKLGIGTGISSLLAAVSYGIIYLTGNSLKSLHDTGEYTNISGNEIKFGDEFAYYFLSAKENENSRIWKSRANTLRISNLESKKSFFKEIKNSADGKSLRDICNQKYDTKFPTNNMTRWKEVWTYCSIGGMRPKTIEEAKYGKETKYRRKSTTSIENTFGKILKNKLIASEDPSNAWFWELRQKEFKDGNLKTKSASTYFVTNTTETIKSLCKRAYGMFVSISNLTSEEVEKYCSIRKIGRTKK